MPFAMTTKVAGPVAIPLLAGGTSNFVETVSLPVATAIVLWSCVRAKNLWLAEEIFMLQRYTYANPDSRGK